MIVQEIGQLDGIIRLKLGNCFLCGTKLKGIPFTRFPLGISGCGLFSSLAGTKHAGKSSTTAILGAYKPAYGGEYKKSQIKLGFPNRLLILVHILDFFQVNKNKATGKTDAVVYLSYQLPHILMAEST